MLATDRNRDGGGRFTFSGQAANNTLNASSPMGFATENWMQYQRTWNARSYCNAAKGASKSARTIGGYAVFGALPSERKSAGFPGLPAARCQALLNHDAELDHAPPVSEPGLRPEVALAASVLWRQKGTTLLRQRFPERGNLCHSVEN
jgi:hypothetical protein